MIIIKIDGNEYRIKGLRCITRGKHEKIINACIKDSTLPAFDAHSLIPFCEKLFFESLEKRGVKNVENVLWDYEPPVDPPGVVH